MARRTLRWRGFTLRDRKAAEEPLLLSSSASVWDEDGGRDSAQQVRQRDVERVDSICYLPRKPPPHPPVLFVQAGLVQQT